MKTLLIAMGFALTSISSAVIASEDNSCNINFDKDITMSNELVSVNEAGIELWRINNQGQLWIKDHAVNTDASTQQLLLDYQAGIRSQTLETVALVEDALVLAADAVSSVFAELTGNTANSNPALQTALDKVKTHTANIVVRSGETINIYGSRFSHIDDAFGKEFEQAIEEAVTSSMGNIFMLVGKAMVSGEGNFEQRMEAFGERMERFGEDLEARIDDKAKGMEQRGEIICASLKELDMLESQIQTAVPQMQQYDLIDVKAESKTAYYLFN